MPLERCCLAVFLLGASVLAAGCGEADPSSPDTANRAPTDANPDTVDARGALADASQSPGKAAVLSGLVTLDGLAKEWKEIEPVWEEGGAAGGGSLESRVDIKQVHVTNDDEHLYVLMRTDPSIQARFDANPVSGELCDLYLDTDNNPDTGCQEIDGFDYGKINGYEFKVWIPLGVRSGADGSVPYVSYDIQHAAKEGEFSMNPPSDSQSSLGTNALIVHGADGVEFAIPLNSLGLQSGQQVRLLLKESVDPFAKDRYSEGVITLR